MNRLRLASIRDWVQCHPLALALLVGLALRLIGLESRSLQYDDTFSIFLSARSLPEILSGTAADTMPPLYYFLLHFWMLIGQSAWFIRLLSVLLSLGVIILLYHLAAAWLGRGAAGWAALLAAVSPLMIYHGQDVRMYALLTAAQLGYLLFFTRIWQLSEVGQARWQDWVGLVLCGGAAMYTHNVAVFALIVPNVYLLVKRRWTLLAKLVAAQAVIGLLALPWLMQIPTQIAKVQKAWTLPRPGAIELLQALLMLTASLPLPVQLLALALLFSLQILAMLGMELWRGRGDNREIHFWLALLLVPPGLLLVASYIMRPIFIPRAFLVSALAYDVIAGWVIAQSWSRGVGKLLVVSFLLAAAFTLPSHYTYNTFPRSPYREAVQYLQQVAQPGDQIVHETKLSYFSSRFYAPGLPQVFLADPAGSANDTFEVGSQKAMQIYPEPDLAAATAGAKSVYFITFSQTFREYQALGLAEHPNIAWLDDHFHQVDRKVFSDLEIYHYER